jgi:hypothetical protein
MAKRNGKRNLRRDPKETGRKPPVPDDLPRSFRIDSRPAARTATTCRERERAVGFVCDALRAGKTFRVLSIVDSFTRECPALEVDTEYREVSG